MQVVSIVATALTCITVVMTPLSGYLPVAHVMVFLVGLSAAAFVTGANVWIIRMWPENTTPALEAFHLAFGVGGLLGPFIARPFLSTVVTGNTTELSTAGFYFGSEEKQFDSPGLLSVPNDTAATNTTGETHVAYAYGIVGAFYFILTLSMIALYLVDRADFKPKAEKTPDGSPATVEERARDVCFTRTVLAAMCTFIGFYVALECTTSQMVASFAVKSNLHFSKASASRVEAMFFLCFSASRLAAALVTVKLPPFWMLVISHTILLPTAIALVIWGSSIDTVLWVCIALAGIGQGPVYAAVMSWTAGHIQFSNKMMSLAVVTESIGGLTAPTLVGQFMDKIPNVFMYVCLGAVAFCAIIFFCMYLYLRIAPNLSNDKVCLINDTDDKPHEGVSC
ncbi:sodium-dependent glucose transporter 1C-like isoform X2 [Amblyomma americanum]